MSDTNRVLIKGRLTKDPDLRTNPNANSVCNISLASNDFYKDKQGQEQKQTCFIDVSIWGKMAIICKDTLTKGSPILVEGKLITENWIDKNQQKHSKIKILANKVHFIIKMEKAEPGYSATEPAPEQPEDDSSIPF